MGQLLAVSEALDRLLTRIGNWAAWLLVPLVIVIIVDVITRKFQLLTSLTESMRVGGNESGAHFIESYLTSTKFQEMEWHLHAALFLLCLGYGYVKNSHVRIELVRERFDLETRAWTEFIGCIIFLLPYASLVLYFSYDFAMRSYEINEVSSALTGLPYRWVIKSFVPIGMVLLLLAAFTVAARNAVFLFGPPGLSEKAQRESPELHLAAEELIQAVVQEAEEITGQKVILPGDKTEQDQ
jgi:TRAP-type mannitol/chloroaromatic compound transport system permease small subunit